MNVILMLLGVLLVYIVIVRIYRTNWNKGLSVTVNFDTAHAVKDDMVNIVEVITNAKRLPLPCINLKFQLDRNIKFTTQDSNSNITDFTYRNDIFSLLFNQRITRRVPVSCTKRGVFRIEHIEVLFSGVFMNEINVYQKDCFSQIVVFPKPADVNAIKVYNNLLLGEVERKKYLYEDKFVFKGIRDYQSYDNMKDINWKATARTGNLMVNEYNETMSKNVCILLNLESDGALRYDKISEEAISIAAGFSQLLIEQGINISVTSNACDVDTHKPVRISYGCGLEHLNAINTALARIDLDVQMQEFADIVKELMNDNKNVVYMIISPSRRKKLQDNMAKLAASQNETLWIVPYFFGDEHELQHSCFNVIPWLVRK